MLPLVRVLYYVRGHLTCSIKRCRAPLFLSRTLPVPKQIVKNIVVSGTKLFAVILDICDFKSRKIGSLFLLAVTDESLCGGWLIGEGHE